MNNLVIGSTGKIGTYYLIKSKYKFNIFTSRKRSSDKKIIFLPLNINKIRNFLKKERISTVVILTAISNPKQCKDNLEYSKKINVIFIKNLIKLLIKLKLYFIFFSSEYVYPDTLNTKKKFTENSKIQTRMIYGKQKIYIEKYLKKNRYKNYSVLRLAKTYGNELNDQTLFTSILNKYKKGKKNFNVANDQFFRPLYINDLIKIIDIFVKNKIKGIYNVSGNTFKSRYDLIKLMIKTLKIKDININKCSIKEFGKNVYYPTRLNLSNSKIKKKLNFKFSDLTSVIKKLDES